MLLFSRPFLTNFGKVYQRTFDRICQDMQILHFDLSQLANI
jgi:hypothetical protein